MKYIHNHPNGFMVRFTRNGKVYRQGFFSDHEEAVAFRDKHLDDHYNHIKTDWLRGAKKGRGFLKLKANNSTGVTGVQYKENVRESGLIHTYWVATWIEDGKQRQKMFRFDDSNNQAQFKKAVKYRKMKEKEVYTDLLH